MRVPEEKIIELARKHLSAKAFAELTFERTPEFVPQVSYDTTTADFDDFLRAIEYEVLAHSPRQVFLNLIHAMNEDNGVYFAFTVDQMVRALPHIRNLLDDGYFLDDPHDLQGSFWQMAAGEETERPIYFAKSPHAFHALDEILNDIFDSPLPEQLRKENPNADTRRMDFLDEMVTEAHVSSCFELDGGVHLTIERPSSEPEAYRNANTLREAIDLAIRNGGLRP